MVTLIQKKHLKKCIIHLWEQRNFLTLIKKIFRKPTASKVDDERLDTFSLRSQTRQEYSLTIPFQKCIGNHRKYNRTIKVNNRYADRKGKNNTGLVYCIIVPVAQSKKSPQKELMLKKVFSKNIDYFIKFDYFYASVINNQNFKLNEIMYNIFKN